MSYVMYYINTTKTAIIQVFAGTPSKNHNCDVFYLI